jgi:glycosyltransferase involved in cell wall biosynthesis
MKVAQVTIGRFHHFHLARQLERHGVLEAVFTGYPRFKLRDEAGIPPRKIHCFPWLYAPYMARGRFGITHKGLVREWEWLARETLDRYAASRLRPVDALIALSGQGVRSGRKVQRRGGKYVCDRGSSHISWQDRILREEFRRWGMDFPGIDPRVIATENEEYATAEVITVPSAFVVETFLEMGVPAEKLAKVPYGARLDRFSPGPDTERKTGAFRVLFVGQVSLRKGFLYLLEAFQKFSHPRKELLVVGSVTPEMELLLRDRKLDGITFCGNVPNTELADLYRSASVFVLPSIEEGLSMVMGEALACGCPVIASTNTGASDIFSDGVEGFIVPIRAPEVIVDRLERLAQDPGLGEKMGNAGVARVKSLGGWDTYGDAMMAELRRICA